MSHNILLLYQTVTGEWLYRSEVLHWRLVHYCYTNRHDLVKLIKLFLLCYFLAFHPNYYVPVNKDDYNMNGLVTWSGPHNCNKSKIKLQYNIQVISRSLRSWGRSSGANTSAVKEPGHYEVRKSKVYANESDRWVYAVRALSPDTVVTVMWHVKSQCSRVWWKVAAGYVSWRLCNSTLLLIKCGVSLRAKPWRARRGINAN